MQKTQPTISVIVASYNNDQYLRKALDSIINQTFKDIEIICVNDGSTDNTLGIMQEYARRDPRLKYIDQKNLGIAGARNTGLRNATGKYLMFCDADDWYEPQMCQAMLRTIEEQDVDFVICDSNVIDQDPNPDRPKLVNDYHYLKSFGRHVLDAQTKYHANINVWNKIFRHEYIKKYGISFPDGYSLEDNAFLYQYMAFSKDFFGLNLKLYNYLMRENSIMSQYFSKKNKEKNYDRFHSLQHACKVMQKNNVLAQNADFIARIINIGICLDMHLFDSDEEFIHDLKLAREVLQMFPVRSYKSKELDLLQAEQYQELIKSLKKSATPKNICGIKIIKSPGKKEWMLGNFSLFKREKTASSIVYSIFNHPIFTKAR